MLTPQTIPRNVISLNAITYIRPIKDMPEELSNFEFNGQYFTPFRADSKKNQKIFQILYLCYVHLFEHFICQQNTRKP